MFLPFPFRSLSGLLRCGSESCADDDAFVLSFRGVQLLFSQMDVLRLRKER